MEFKGRQAGKGWELIQHRTSVLVRHFKLRPQSLVSSSATSHGGLVFVVCIVRRQ